jgi:rod shape determining protein RodA
LILINQDKVSLKERIQSFCSGWQQLDFILLFLVVGLTIFSGFMIQSTERNTDLTDWIQHWIFGGVGLILALIISRFRYHFLLKWHWLTYAVTTGLLIAVMVVGASAKGAQRWISIGGFNVQPSEFSKLALIITLAALLHLKPAKDMGAIFSNLVITAIPWALVFLQPDLGTSLVFGVITLTMLYWGNVNPGWLILMIAPIPSAILFSLFPTIWAIWLIALAAIAWFTLPWRKAGTLFTIGINVAASNLGHILWGLLKDYQKDRLILFLDPYKDPLGGGYHLIQSRIAIGAGQLWGKGFNNGTQTQLKFIPEQHTDFIFSSIGEELGFIGSVGILIVFWLICFRLVWIACHAKENFGSYIAIGVLAMIAFQVVVNIGMNIGVAPVTGIPLPWMSYGRSSLLTNFMAIGLVESVANFRQKSRY